VAGGAIECKDEACSVWRATRAASGRQHRIVSVRIAGELGSQGRQTASSSSGRLPMTTDRGALDAPDCCTRMSRWSPMQQGSDWQKKGKRAKG